VTASLDYPPNGVVAHFALHTTGLTWHRVRGGLSGARVWRGEDAVGAPRVALKLWPPEMTAERLRQIHAWMTQAGHLRLVPRVLAGAHGLTVCVEGGRAWDACEWLPGEPRDEPSLSEVEAACEAVALLHVAWSASQTRGPCPGVLNRLHILTENEPLLRARPESLPPAVPQLDALLRRGLGAVARAAPQIRESLRPWVQWSFPLQPCVRDLRGEHVLFEDGRVRGVIDFGALAVDHPAVDLARLLGDFSDIGDGRFAAGLNAYARAGGQLDVSDEFVRLLAGSGAVCSVLGWLVRLVIRRESAPDVIAVASRLARLVARVEQFAPA
jgi:homoserine kinase type II